MFKDGIVLVVICLIVVGGIFAWWSQTSTPSAGASPTMQVQAPEPVKAAPVAAKAVRLKPSAEPVTEPPASEIAPVIPAPAPVVQRDPLPFPAVEQIAAGSREGSITGKFGNPSLAAVTSTGGHMVETFVYAKDRGRSATVIRLEDGKVAATYSQSEPILAPGLSAPRRWHSE